MRENKTSIFYVFLLNLLMLIPAAVSPIFPKVFTDYVLTGNMREWLPTLLLLMVFMAAFSASLILLQRITLVKMANKVEISGASRYMWRLFHSPLAMFVGADSNQLLSKVDASKGVSGILTASLLAALFSIINLVFYFIMMLKVDRMMALIVVGLIVVTFFFSKLQAKILSKLVSKQEVLVNDASGMIAKIDTRLGSLGLHEIETIKSTSSEMHFFQRLMGVKVATIHAKRAGDYTSAAAPINGLPSVLFLNLLLLISSLRIMDQNFTIGAYLAFQAYASAFFGPLNSVLTMRAQLKGFEGQLDGFYQDIDTEFHPDKPTKAPETPRLSGRIEFKDVCFGYDKEHKVLQNFNLSIEPGQRVAIMGQSGAGKSTVLKLLQGLYEPDSGEITIDGMKVSEIDRQVLQSSIGSANQQINIFSASMRDNITLWDDTVSDSEVYRAASDATLHEYISSLNGAYQYELTEGGRNLSGGQQQRLEIARAFLYNPSILILDEVTSSLDPATSGKIHQTLINRGCTCVSVTHVVSSTLDYDNIIVLENGTISKSGTHEELMKNSNYYASLFKSEGWMMP